MSVDKQNSFPDNEEKQLRSSKVSGRPLPDAPSQDAGVDKTPPNDNQKTTGANSASFDTKPRDIGKLGQPNCIMSACLIMHLSFLSFFQNSR